MIRSLVENFEEIKAFSFGCMVNVLNCTGYNGELLFVIFASMIGFSHC